MKLNLIILAICSCLAIYSCKEKPSQPSAESATNDSTDQEISYLPVDHLIREDIRRVDSFAAGILYKKETTVKDSAYIKPEEFKKLSEQFLLPELEAGYFEKNFSGESFMDETTELINFIYTSKNPESQLRKVVVYIRPSLGVDKVSRIYMEKEFKEESVSVQQKLIWTIGKYFYVLTIRNTPGGEPVTTIEKLIWDPQSYAD